MSQPQGNLVPDKRPAINGRRYKELACKLAAELAAGLYPLGSRLPGERELALRFDVSRPTVREAIISLEVQGLVEVRGGSGARVRQLRNGDNTPKSNVTGFELIEACLLFEGEAAALAATQISDEEIIGLEALFVASAHENHWKTDSEDADREFHLGIARSARNQAIYHVVEHLWELRRTSSDAALLHQKRNGAALNGSVNDEHNAVLSALRAKDPEGARAAMRAHLATVLDGLLLATEELAVDEARKAAAAKRARYRNQRLR